MTLEQVFEELSSIKDLVKFRLESGGSLPYIMDKNLCCPLCSLARVKKPDFPSQLDWRWACEILNISPDIGDRIARVADGVILDLEDLKLRTSLEKACGIIK
jgi:hypothetical protein